MKALTWTSKLVLPLIIFLPLYFIIGALGTKFGIWGYEIGLGFFVFRAGIYVLGIVAIISLLALIVALLRKPRVTRAIVIASIGVLLPFGFLAWGASVGGTAAANPIHDVATDTADPPKFSQATMAARKKAKANPLPDYQTPLGEMKPWKGNDRISEADQRRSHAQFITSEYASLSPLPLGQTSREDAIAAVAAAMEDMGLSDIREDDENAMVEGVAETFWYGFRDDVVARIGDNQIDFRSVSRVGQSDLGANAARIEELRGKVEALLGQP